MGIGAQAVCLLGQTLLTRGRETVVATQPVIHDLLAVDLDQAVGPESVQATAVLPRQLMRRFTLVIAPINFVIATFTYVFVAYVVPLPGRAPPARGRTTVLLAAVVGFAAAWAVCEIWGRHSFIPVRRW